MSRISCVILTRRDGSFSASKNTPISLHFLNVWQSRNILQKQFLKIKKYFEVTEVLAAQFISEWYLFQNFKGDFLKTIFSNRYQNYLLTDEPISLLKQEPIYIAWLMHFEKFLVYPVFNKQNHIRSFIENWFIKFDNSPFF